MKIAQYIRYLWFRFLAVWNRAPVARCATCPYWIYHSSHKVNLPTIYRVGQSIKRNEKTQFIIHRAGICHLDKPETLMTQPMGHALRIWNAQDTCARHPLHVSRIIPDSDLEFRPGRETKANAGFSRIPSFKEALAMTQDQPEVQAMLKEQGNKNPKP